MKKLSMKKWLSLFIAAMLAFSALGFVACSDGGDDGVAENSLSAPSGLAVVASTTKNAVKVTWTDNGSAYYWIYYNSSNDTGSATCATKAASSTSATYGYEITLPATGTYYFWVKAADGYASTSSTSSFGASVSYAFTYTALSVPTGVSVTTSKKTNTVKITWTDNSSTYYWIYYNSSNDTENATCATKAASSINATYGYEVTLPTTGTYYFWVKSADGYTSTSATSDFSTAVSHSFTYTSLTAPTGVTVEAAETAGKVKVKWTDNNAAYYWVYYNSSNDNASAYCATKAATAILATYGYEITLPTSGDYYSASGTYYFWVKSADGYSSTSATSAFSTAATYTVN